MTAVSVLHSRDNPRLRRARGLRHRQVRSRSGRFLVEGEDIAAEALAAGILPEETFVSLDRPPDEGLVARLARGGPVSQVADLLLSDLGTLEHPARVICVFAAAALPKLAGQTLGLHLQGVSDPGNVGTAVRAAAAFGPAFVSLAPGSADPTSSRALRAAMGAIFQVPCVRAGAPPRGLLSVGLDAHASDPLWSLDLKAPTVFVVGAERGGLPEEVRAGCDHLCRIPMTASAESLNAAQAATIALHEAFRQRNAADPAR